MPEAERVMIEKELDRIIENSNRYGANRKFEKVHYMERVLRAMSSGAKYEDLDKALTANAAAYDNLHVSTSNAGMIAGEIRRTYFHGNLENALVNGLDRNDSQLIVGFMNDRLRKLEPEF